MQFPTYKHPRSVPRGKADGKQVISDSPPSPARKGRGPFLVDFRRLPCRSVLTMSAYAYQEASSLVLAGQWRRPAQFDLGAVTGRVTA